MSDPASVFQDVRPQIQDDQNTVVNMNLIMLSGRIPQDPDDFLRTYLELEVKLAQHLYWEALDMHTSVVINKDRFGNTLELDKSRTNLRDHEKSLEVLTKEGNPSARMNYSKQQQGYYEKAAENANSQMMRSTDQEERAYLRRATEANLSKAIFWEQMAEYYSDQLANRSVTSISPPAAKNGGPEGT